MGNNRGRSHEECFLSKKRINGVVSSVELSVWVHMTQFVKEECEKPTIYMHKWFTKIE